MFNPQLDLVIWLVAALLLVLFGVRAWLVETGRARLGRSSAKIRALTVASVLAICGLTVLMWFQGGWLMYDAIFKGTDPQAVYYSSDDTAVPAPPPVDPAAPPVDPAAPPADPAAPPAPPAGGGPPPAGGPAAPPAGA
jgi:hypothetical protein